MVTNKLAAIFDKTFLTAEKQKVNDEGGVPALDSDAKVRKEYASYVSSAEQISNISTGITVSAIVHKIFIKI